MQYFVKFYKTISRLTVFCFIIFICWVLCVDTRYFNAVKNGLNVWQTAVLPLFLPYLFITYYLANAKTLFTIGKKLQPLTLKIFNVSALTGYAFLLSLFCGYTVSLKLILDFKNANLITDTEAERAVTFCATPSPALIIGCVGGITFNDVRFGALLFLTLALSSFLTGVVFSFYKRKETPLKLTAPLPFKPYNFYDGIYSAIYSTVLLGGVISVFYLLTEFLTAAKILPFLTDVLTKVFGDGAVARGLTLGGVDLMQGLKALAGGGINRSTLAVAGFIAGFGGISSVAQGLTLIKGAKIKPAVFIAGKTLTAGLCAIIGSLLGGFF